MKLKYNFVMRDIDNQPVAVAVGKDNAKFNGMIRMNQSGAYIFQLLKEDMTIEQIVEAVVSKYDVSMDIATNVVNDFINILRKDKLIIE